MGKLDGKVAFISGGARGQGRSHALVLAREGADIITFDLCDQIATAPYPMSTKADLAATVEMVEQLDRRIVALEADVRDRAQVESVVKAGLAELGKIDIIVANAGIFSAGNIVDLSDETWRDMLDVNLTGVFNTVRAAIPSMISRGEGGAIVLTSSGAGLKGTPGLGHYVAAKHGVVGLMRTLSNELGRYSIRVNSVHPSNTDTDMINNDAVLSLFFPDAVTLPDRDEFLRMSQGMHVLPVSLLSPADISNAILFLVSDDARYITGETLRIDAGFDSKQH